jgi:CDP-glucose 4,6-dehydratase
LQRFETSLSGKKIFMTGHTGFTGSWTSLWLQSLGAIVYGYSLAPEGNPNLFTAAKVGELVDGKISDIRDFDTLSAEMAKFNPDLVLHLAAQPLVLESYRIPRETFEINSQGTANVLEASRLIPSIKGILCITTDKVYTNLETEHRFIETDKLGGKDPYSASKAAAEVVIASYRESFRSYDSEKQVVSVARGGNIIGGGDWSRDRLLPDYIRAYETKSELLVRFPNATRPWQHVLSLIDGYLSILSGMLGPEHEKFNRAFNLGPTEQEEISVSSLIDLVSKEMPGVKVRKLEPSFHEAGRLSLNSNMATEVFGWKPRWGTIEAVEKTVAWYRDYLAGTSSAHQLCLDQIDSLNTD